MTDAESTIKGKNIVIFSDGTGQEGGKGNNTNVYKLFNMVEDRTSAQITFYDRGLGTDWRKVTGNIGGAGISKNILDCYQFISDHYKWGDQIYLFGFSRGATTVRSLSGFLCMFGILPNSRPELTKKAYDIYRISNDEKRKKATLAFLQQNNTTYCNIKFLGVWDTVAALGLPIKGLDALLGWIPAFKHSFHDLKLSSRVQHGYHALAIDEARKVFQPTVWHTVGKDGVSLLGEVPIDPRESDLDDQQKKDRSQTVKQVWFCGAHTDVGGGFKEHGISDIALAWMIDRAMEYGLRLYQWNGVEIEQNAEDAIHDSRNTWAAKLLYPKKVRGWDAQCGPLIVHESVLKRKQATKDDPVPYDPWILKLDESAYDVEPWDNLDEPLKYGINIEYEYRSHFDTQIG